MRNLEAQRFWVGKNQIIWQIDVYVAKRSEHLDLHFKGRGNAPLATRYPFCKERTVTQLFHMVRIQFPFVHSSKARPVVHSERWNHGLFSAPSEPNILLRSVLIKVRTGMDGHGSLTMNVTSPANPKYS